MAEIGVTKAVVGHDKRLIRSAGDGHMFLWYFRIPPAGGFGTEKDVWRADKVSIRVAGVVDAQSLELGGEEGGFTDEEAGVRCVWANFKSEFPYGDLEFAGKLGEEGEGRPCMHDIIFGVIW